MIKHLREWAVLTGACSIFISSLASATEIERRHVDLVIALDVSGSMSGLIESAKQRLWDVVNELGRAQPTPVLRVAILSYGNPAYGANDGFVRIDQPFTSDLDAVNETLFAFGTNGGDEWVARAVDRSVHGLQWSTGPDAVKIMFVAGNEPATQDPEIGIETAAYLATDKGIVVNTIYCGDGNDALAPDWHRLATLTNGHFASIDQNAAAVAAIATPYDDKLAELNAQLNETYVAYGTDGMRFRDNQLEQDRNAAEMSPQAAASRAITKASAFYDSAKWDLVDAVESGKSLDEFEEAELPAEMQAMGDAEREAFVAEQAAKREDLREQIAATDADRQAFIAEERKKQANAPAGLDDAMLEALRQSITANGFEFGTN